MIGKICQTLKESSDSDIDCDALVRDSDNELNQHLDRMLSK